MVHGVAMFVEGEEDCPGSPVIPDQSFNNERRHARFLVSAYIITCTCANNAAAIKNSINSLIQTASFQASQPVGEKLAYFPFLKPWMVCNKNVS